MISITTNNGRGRAVKFTPERIEQIRNLIERGTSREEIAAIIGVTVGSLQVTCSRLGISLRRRALDNGVRSLPRPAAFPTPSPSRDAPGLALVLVDGDRRRETPLDLPREVRNRIALEAGVRGVRFADVVVDWLSRVAQKE